MVNLASFWKPEACGQTVLPDRSVLIGQKLVENAKMQNSNATFWVIFKQCEKGLIFFLLIFEDFFCLTCHGSSANFALWPPMIRFANWRCLVIPHSGSLCRISLATRFWARPVPTKVSCNKENQISFFVAHRLSSSKQSRVFSRSDVIWIFRLMDTPLLLYTWQRNSLSGS